MSPTRERGSPVAAAEAELIPPPKRVTKIVIAKKTEKTSFS